MALEDLMQQSIEIAIERDVLAKEVELMRKLVEQYEAQVAALKEANAALRQLAAQQSQPFGIPLPVMPSEFWAGGRCGICGEPGGHGNLSCPKMAPRAG